MFVRSSDRIRFVVNFASSVVKRRIAYAKYRQCVAVNFIYSAITMVFVRLAPHCRSEEKPMFSRDLLFFPSVVRRKFFSEKQKTKKENTYIFAVGRNRKSKKKNILKNREGPPSEEFDARSLCPLPPRREIDVA